VILLSHLERGGLGDVRVQHSLNVFSAGISTLSATFQILICSEFRENEVVQQIADPITC
jgi:hypothetical protein